MEALSGVHRQGCLLASPRHKSQSAGSPACWLARGRWPQTFILIRTALNQLTAQVVTTVRDEQLLPGGSIPANKMLPHDVPVDVIVTPTQVRGL